MKVTKANHCRASPSCEVQVEGLTKNKNKPRKKSSVKDSLIVGTNRTKNLLYCITYTAEG